jgi:DNA helicase-2/ATP-dependent DNA helicase PcrA
MIHLTDYRTLLETVRGNPFNPGQWNVIRAGPTDCLHVVAGPGTGKTTSLVGRILKLIFVDQLPPGSILATTFTKKAAEELRSRILSQGMALKDVIAVSESVTQAAKTWAKSIDVNQVLTGTIDSVCQEILREYKEPGARDPEPVDEFITRTLMFRDGLLFSGHASNKDLHAFLLPVYGPNSFGFNASRIANLIEQIYQRNHCDLVNFPAFLCAGSTSDQAAKATIEQIIQRYETRLHEIGAIDFVQLEATVLMRFQAAPPNNLDAWRRRIRAVIVDEYQDTNCLQEAIYFEIGKICRAITVVGDDDQSLYRFRGATVELFTNFPKRVRRALKVSSSTFFLSENYRSSPPIVELVNEFAGLDIAYQSARVKGPGADSKTISAAATVQSVFPVLGIFRDNLEDLGAALSEFLRDVFRRNGRHIPGAGVLVKDPIDGDLGDCCLLSSSHREFTDANPPRIRLPRMLREKLRDGNPGIAVFNPRGQSIGSIDEVQIFGGYTAHVINGERDHLTTSGIGRFDPAATAVMHEWLDAATNHFNDATTPQPLKDYVEGWVNRYPGRGKNWPRSVSLLEFLNGLQHFFPEFHDDPEGQLYYEAFTRQFQACQQISRFHGDLIYDPTRAALEERAAHDLFEFLLGPIASGGEGVNEDLIETFPRNRLSVLSIHQAKGLEFPMVIVDIGSDFKRNHPQQRRNRFPDYGETPHKLENLMRPFAKDLGSPKRSERDRAFDDLYRKFFVAFSRPEQCLVLVGLTGSMPHGGNIPNAAAGWDRSGVNRWPASVPIHYL